MRYAAITLALLLIAAGCGKPGGDILDLELGDCIEDPGTTSGTVSSLDKTACTTSGSLRAGQVFDVWAPDADHDQWPGDDFISNVANLQCARSTKFFLRPTED